jgi:hypothetical protein
VAVLQHGTQHQRQRRNLASGQRRAGPRQHARSVSAAHRLLVHVPLAGMRGVNGARTCTAVVRPLLAAVAGAST